MNLLGRLSSQQGDRTEGANREVVLLCLNDPELLREIEAGLTLDDPKLLGDCAEVLTKVAEVRPDLIVPFATQLAELSEHPNTRVRWEVMHALALIAAHVPQTITTLLPTLSRHIRDDKSTIVRDYSVDTLGAYARTGAAAAAAAYPLLVEALSLWSGKHAARALTGLQHVAAVMPETAGEILALAESHSDSSRGVVRKAAKSLTRAVERLLQDS